MEGWKEKFMKDLNKEKNRLVSRLIEDKLQVDKKMLINLKQDLIEVLDRYTILKKESISINIEIIDGGNYQLNCKVCFDDFC